MVDWGICATLKAPADQVLAFAAHHLALGAHHLWLHFDDPDDPAVDLAASLPRTTAVRCDETYWQATVGRRPEKHQNRQARNIQRVCAQTGLPWVAHLDVDEFLVASRPVSDCLARLPPDRMMLRIAPWEALHDPGLPDDVFTARHFRAALRGPSLAAARARLFGPYAPLLPDGVLSHAAGKCFFRTGVRRLEPRIHGAFYARARLPGGDFDPDLALLHFHAQDPARWLASLPFRLTRGAYQFNPPLQQFLATADTESRAAFYARVQHASPDTLAILADLGILRAELLTLRARIAALTALRPPAPRPS